MDIELLDSALAEAGEAAAWYDEQVPALGADFLQELDRAVSSISERPQTWPRLGQVRGRSFRRFLLSRFPYGVVYTILPAHALVVAVAHLRRRPQYWADRVPPSG